MGKSVVGDGYCMLMHLMHLIHIALLHLMTITPISYVRLTPPESKLSVYNIQDNGIFSGLEHFGLWILQSLELYRLLKFARCNYLEDQIFRRQNLKGIFYSGSLEI
jgi:hypothetical protein